MQGLLGPLWLAFLGALAVVLTKSEWRHPRQIIIVCSIGTALFIVGTTLDVAGELLVLAWLALWGALIVALANERIVRGWLVRTFAEQKQGHGGAVASEAKLAWQRPKVVLSLCGAGTFIFILMIMAVNVDDARAQRAAAQAAAAQQAAAQKAALQRAAAERAAHEQRLAWQRAHPAEYARQRATARAQRAAAQAALRRQIAQEHAQQAAQAAEERRQARIPMYQYWSTAKAALDDAVSSAHAAADALSNEDLVTASGDFSDCADKASDALTTSGDDVPDGWQDVSDALGVAASKLEDACKTAVSALDDEKPSEIAAALTQISDFNAAETIAVIKAEELWLNAGGNASDL